MLTHVGVTWLMWGCGLLHVPFPHSTHVSFVVVCQALGERAWPSRRRDCETLQIPCSVWET
jgi:hypothetical protein